MALELAPHAYPRALALFAELAHHLSIAAVVAGSMPGRVFVDDEDAPRAALITSPEGAYLAAAGPPDAAARALLRQISAHGPALELYVAPDWEQHAEKLLPGARCVLVARRRYALSALASEWHAHVPAALALRRLDAETLAMPALRDHHIQRWARGNWGSGEAFLAAGFGFALFHAGQPASWCLADSAVGARCEVGIHTHPAYRRQGLATVVVAATVAHALAHGYREVGWHCGEDNHGSQGVAEKVGFRLTHRFHALAYRIEGEG